MCCTLYDYFIKLISLHSLRFPDILDCLLLVSPSPCSSCSSQLALPLTNAIISGPQTPSALVRCLNTSPCCDICTYTFRLIRILSSLCVAHVENRFETRSRACALLDNDDTDGTAATFSVFGLAFVDSDRTNRQRSFRSISKRCILGVCTFNWFADRLVVVALSSVLAHKSP